MQTFLSRATIQDPKSRESYAKLKTDALLGRCRSYLNDLDRISAEIQLLKQIYSRSAAGPTVVNAEDRLGNPRAL